MSEMFRVTTDTGVTANKGAEKNAPGLTESQAKADAEKRNAQAESMGLKVRYEVRPL